MTKSELTASPATTRFNPGKSDTNDIYNLGTILAAVHLVFEPLDKAIIRILNRND
jgi:hypothetical protein